MLAVSTALELKMKIEKMTVNDKEIIKKVMWQNHQINICKCT